LKDDKIDLKRIISSIIETLVVNEIIYYYFYRMQANQDLYINLNPHPLLFLCAFMGLRYGKKLGAVTSLITCAFFVYVFVSLGNSLSSFFEYFSNFKNPLIFLWVALILGTFRDNHYHKLKNAEDENQELREEYRKLEKDFRVIDKVQKELKKQIIGSDESIISLYDIASKLETFEIEDIFTETIGILKKYLKVQDAAIYYYDERSQYLRLKILYGTNRRMNRSSFPVDEFPCFRNAVTNRAVERWRKSNSETQPLMIAPLIKDDKIIALISIENMEFDILSEYAYSLFKLITDWVNKALSRAHYVEDLESSKYIENTILATPEYFNKRLAIEERRLKEFNMEYGLLRFKNKTFPIYDLNVIVGRSLRVVDVVGYNVDTNILSILLPATQNSALQMIKERTISNFGYRLEEIK
jgi:K+-sensing histidine kinase KdpD